LESEWSKFPVHGDCSLGRSPKNAIVLDSPKVSRRHAIINVQNVGEFWLIDLGSRNGTFLNKRRIHEPLRLSDYDQIVIADSIFTFRQPEQLTDDYRTTFVERTIRGGCYAGRFHRAKIRVIQSVSSRSPASLDPLSSNDIRSFVSFDLIRACSEDLRRLARIHLTRISC